MIRVLAVSSWGTPCGIANHTDQIREALPETIDMEIDQRALDPQVCLTDGRTLPDVVWLNHHDGLHSQWSAEHVRALRSSGVPVVVTYHDTLRSIADTPKLQMFLREADQVIVHEQVLGLTTEEEGKLTVMRQGIPPPAGKYELPYPHVRPYLGTAGFDFPWKNYTRLAELTAEIGWGFVLHSNNLSDARVAELSAINPHHEIHVGFSSTSQIISILAGCTATAWMYECANTGTSGAIRLGIAARKPVYALQTCRQFGDLLAADPDTSCGRHFNWVSGWGQLRNLLIRSWPVDLDPAMVYVATRDSIEKVAARYAEIFNTALGPR